MFTRMGMLFVLLAVGFAVLFVKTQKPANQNLGSFKVGEVSGDILGSISPDGRFLSYMDKVEGKTEDEVFVLDFKTGERRRLTDAGPAGEAGDSRISGDGQQVAYGWITYPDRSQELRIIGVDGSGARVVYRSQDARMLSPEDWSADGKHILVTLWLRDTDTSRIALVSVADGTVRVLRTFNGPPPPGRMSLSPDARYIAYDSLPQEGSPLRHIVILALPTEPDDAQNDPREVPLLDQPGVDQLLGWMPDGSGILFSSNRRGTTDAWLMPVFGGKPQGSPTMIRADVGPIAGLGLEFSRNGSYYYGVSAWVNDVYLTILDPSSGKLQKPTKPVSHVGPNTSVDWSPDGQYLVYVSRRGPVGVDEDGYGLGIRSAETGMERQLQVQMGGLHQVEPHWSRDGRFLLVHGRDLRLREGLYRIDAQTGATTPIFQPECLLTGCLDFPAWASDRNAIFLRRGGTGIVARDLETGQEQVLYRPIRAEGVSRLALSPDGRHLAFVSLDGDSAMMAVKIMPASGGEPRAILKLPARDQAHWWPRPVFALGWTPDSRHIIYAPGTPGTRRVELWRIAADGGEAQNLGLAIDGVLPGGLSIHPDGRRIAFTAGREPYLEIWVMENFVPPLKATK